MAASPRKRLALDANLLLDLAEGRDFAHEFREEFLARGYEFLVPPTVAGELLDIDEDALLLSFDEADLLPVHPVHPKRLLRALR